MIVTLLLAAAAVAAPDPKACRLDDAAKRANAALTFDQFDQQGTLATSARKLGERGCWREAAEATVDYLIRGPVATPGEQRILLFHLGQQLALAGDERRGAEFIAGTRRSDQPMAPMSTNLRWNEYVTGTWAFRTQDRPLLIKSRDAVLAGTSEGDRINGKLLEAMERCFDRPYEVAYDPQCGAAR
jgi:hypothetical protein